MDGRTTANRAGLAKRITCRIFQTSTSEISADAARTRERVLGQRQLDWGIGLVAVAAFVLYWVSSFALQARGATLHFGADAHLYDDLARNTAVDRVARFHPVTVALALSWMNVLSPLTHWITPQQLLKAMFAAVGAVGVWASMAAFTIAFQRRYVILWGVIYATSFGVWYFSSIEESKIVTASLTALYIALYLRLRERWTPPRAALLTAILLVACLNEIVSCFLIAIPAVDTLVRYGWDWRKLRWIGAHALTAPIAFVVLEVVVGGLLLGVAPEGEGHSHVSMLIFYVLKNNYDAGKIYAFALNWSFFNLVAPEPSPRWVFPPYGGYFDAAFTNYYASPISSGAIALLSLLLIAGWMPRYRPPFSRDVAAILLGLLAYAMARCLFFFVFNPGEALLFSPAVTLPHILLIGTAFLSSPFPGKGAVLGALAACLSLTNGAFMFGW
jgi:hypothetical protein